MATLENDIKVAEERIREMEKRRSYFAEKYAETGERRQNVSNKESGAYDGLRRRSQCLCMISRSAL